MSITGIILIAICVVILFACAGITIGITLFAFYNPIEKRRYDTNTVPDNDMYHQYRDDMLDALKYMHSDTCEEITTKAFDGITLNARYFEYKKGAPTILFFHGYKGVWEYDGYGAFKICRDNGINLLAVDQRAHGKSKEKFITFGIKERRDVLTWVDYIDKNYSGNLPIVLMGVSMGSATVLMSSDMEMSKNVVGVVADCGYVTPKAIIKNTAKNMNPLLEKFYCFAKLGAFLFGGCRLEETSALEAVSNTKLPIMFIHGKQDGFVPFSMGEELFEKCNSKKKMVVFDNADHAVSSMTDYTKYNNCIIGFLKNDLGLEINNLNNKNMV